jgi:hypothetical protein
MSDLTAGRELDALVAEKVMGWTVNRTESRHWHTVGPTGRERNIQIGSDCCAGQAYDSNAFMPSKSIASAWLVVESRPYGTWNWRVSMEDGPEDRRWFAEVRVGYGTSYSHAYPVWAATPAEAICLAALSAVSVAEHQDV